MFGMVEVFGSTRKKHVTESGAERYSARHLTRENQRFLQSSAVALFNQLERLMQVNERFEVYYDRERLRILATPPRKSPFPE